MRKAYAPGDWVVYRKSKQSSAPGPRAQRVMASSKGEKYSYVVDKFWVVDAVLPGDKLLLRTRRGKVHEISAHDENLRCANWLHRMLYRHRFPQPGSSDSVTGGSAGLA